MTHSEVEEPSFRAGWHLFRCWRGPAWINTVWLLAPALRRFGYEREAERLLCSCLELIERHGFREYYNPLNGEGLAARQFGWSTLLADLVPGPEEAADTGDEPTYVGNLRSELWSLGEEVAGELRRGLSERAARARRHLREVGSRDVAR